MNMQVVTEIAGIINISHESKEENLHVGTW